MNKKYAIQEFSYPYDNYYYTTEPEDMSIYDVFDTKKEAENELKDILVETYYNYKSVDAGDQSGVTFSTFDVFLGEGTDEVNEKLADFYKRKTGKVLELENIDEVLKLNLSDDEIVELMLLSGINQYNMIEIDEDQDEDELYAIWIPDAKKYFGQIFGQTIITFDNDILEFDSDDMIAGFVSIIEDYSPKGAITEISDQPDELLEVINNSSYIDYDDEEQRIYIDLYGIGYSRILYDLVELSNLLKTPWLEIRPLSISQLQKLNSEREDDDKDLIMAQDEFDKANLFNRLIFDDCDKRHQALIKAIEHYQQGLAYAKQALLTHSEPSRVKLFICNNLYQMARIADESARLLIHENSDSNDLIFCNTYLSTVINYWQIVIDAYIEINNIDDIDCYPDRFNMLITAYAEYALKLHDVYLREELNDKDTFLEVFYAWLSELADLLIVSRKRFGDEFLQRNDPVLKFEHTLGVPIIKAIQHLMFNGGLDAGLYADKISLINPDDSGRYYNIAKKLLKQSLLIDPCSGTALSILSMYVRHYIADTQKFSNQLDLAKNYFEELLEEYPDFIGGMSFNRACIAGLENDVENVITYLTLSHQKGYLPSKQKLIEDSDFDNVRNNDDFKKFIESIE